MVEQSAEYQSKVGRTQGGEQFFIREDGTFKFFDTDYYGSWFRNYFNSFSLQTVIANSAGVLSTTTLTSMGHVVFSIAAAASNASADLAVPSIGQQLWLHLDKITAGGSVLIKASTGVTLIDINTASVSLISLSAGEPGRLHLMCHAAGVWTVIDNNTGNIDLS